MTLLRSLSLVERFNVSVRVVLIEENSFNLGKIEHVISSFMTLLRSPSFIDKAVCLSGPVH